jgi:hypothetical protein
VAAAVQVIAAVAGFALMRAGARTVPQASAGG